MTPNNDSEEYIFIFVYTTIQNKSHNNK